MVLCVHLWLIFMRISNQWLSEWVALPASSEALNHTFQMAGIGVDEFEDDVWSLEVTSNRGDWLSAIGLAREIAAMTGAIFHLPPLELEEKGAPIAERVQVAIEDANDCPRYVARLIENLRIGPSPEWMQKRLTECGMRPVNNVVDVTNYVMLETGQPLHAFDADKVLCGDGIHRIVVRRARDGETLVTLDGVERVLDSEVLVIADAQNAIGIAGVMGGQNSEISETTTRVLLESAHFAPGRVRRSRRRVGMQSEASRRFERWVDPNAARRAADRAAQLLIECAGGLVAAGVVDRYDTPIEDARATLRPSRANRKLGLNLSREEMIGSLRRLGLIAGAQSDDLIAVSVPTWRRDIEREEDLIEEVARLHGYDQIPTTLPRTHNIAAGLPLPQRLQGRAREALLRCGLSEILTYSLQSPAAVARAGLDEQTPVVRLRNPLSEDYSQLRTSLLPSLLEVLGRNVRREVRVFELGKVYCPQETDDEASAPATTVQPDESLRLALAMLDAPPLANWQKIATPIDFFSLKAMVENLIAAMGAPVAQWSATQRASFHPGRCALISVDGHELGVAGEVHPDIAENYDLTQRAFVAEIDFEALLRHVAIAPHYVPIVRFPPSDRDLALVLKREVLAAQVEAVLQAAGGPVLESVRVFDIYTGPPIGENEKSLTLALRFRSPHGTLTDGEVDAAMTRLREVATEQLGAQLRT